MSVEIGTTCRKYVRRARNAEWADAYLKRAPEAGDVRRASRAAGLLESLQSWLAQNAPFDVSTFSES
jgi:hypothetical protein